MEFKMLFSSTICDEIDNYPWREPEEEGRGKNG
jgi:hypothetical protein